MRIEDILMEFATRIGLSPDADEDGRFTLVFDDAHEVTFEPDGDTLLLHSPLEGKAFADMAAHNPRSLLELSYLGSGTAGCALSLCPSTGSPVLWTRVTGLSDVNDLEHAVNGFLGSLAAVLERTQGDSSFPDESQPPEYALNMLGMVRA